MGRDLLLRGIEVSDEAVAGLDIVGQVGIAEGFQGGEELRGFVEGALLACLIGLAIDCVLEGGKVLRLELGLVGGVAESECLVKEDCFIVDCETLIIGIDLFNDLFSEILETGLFLIKAGLQDAEEDV